jgi:hypothetical protein
MPVSLDLVLPAASLLASSGTLFPWIEAILCSTELLPHK